MAIPIPRRRRAAPRRPRHLGFWLLGVLALYLVVRVGLRLLVELLWFRELGYPQVLETRILTQAGLAAAGFGLAFAALYVNARLALTRSPVLRLGAQGELHLSLLELERRMPRMVALASAGLALAFASALAGRWMSAQLFAHDVPYGTTEPLFGNDVGFYLFRLPFLRFAVGWLLGLAVVSLGGTGALYLARGGLAGPRGPQPAGLRHLGVLGGVALVLVAAWFGVAQYDVLWSPHGAIHGAGWTDVHVRLPGLRLLIGLAALAAGFGVWAAWRGRVAWLLAVPAVLLGLYLGVTAMLPALLQKLVVEPNELEKERPYIEHALRLTREAYDLDQIEERPFDVDPQLAPRVLQSHRDLVENIRLWDWNPLLTTYGQIQEIRLYYNFADVDIDRYMLDGQYRQVMLSPRELSYEQVPEGARTWVNLHLKYTHGYGLCMSPVNRITKEGLPELYIRDIPPVSTVDLTVERPEIYFGEQTSVFALVGTSTDEFDYPVGETNQMTRYAGRGGIGVGSLPRRLLFAAALGSRELLLTSYLAPESRILLRRSLGERAPRLAPFLRYDGDPYIVVHEGRLVWIHDAYTSSDRFPYSRPIGPVNYLRNAVKVTVDAYDGTTRFYVADPQDPMLRAYARIFPGLFRPLDEMPAGLRAHLRFPEDLFQVQAQVFATYHMRDAQVFYNREDLWQMPVETVGGRETPVEPYYTILRLPDSDRLELILMLPFTPARKDNMIAWMAARCDGEALGKRVVYLFPKQELVYGPRQIEARIDQDAVISQQLTLWSQRGSNIIRGNLLVIPIGRAILYVEPLYLQAAKGALPELKRVILAQAERIEMGVDLETTLAMLTGMTMAQRAASLAEEDVAAAGPAATGGATPSPEPVLGGLAAQRALQMLQAAENAVQRGDWEAYGRDMQRLRQFLAEQAAGGGSPR